MARVFGYRKVTDQYTTHSVQGEGIIELCQVDGTTYISIPDNVQPEVPGHITLTKATLTKKLKKRIKKASPHVKLIRRRVVSRIRKEYSIEDEIKLIRRKLAGDATVQAELDEYNIYVQKCRAWGKAEKKKLGL